MRGLPVVLPEQKQTEETDGRTDGRGSCEVGWGKKLGWRKLMVRKKEGWERGMRE